MGISECLFTALSRVAEALTCALRDAQHGFGERKRVCASGVAEGQRLKPPCQWPPAPEKCSLSNLHRTTSQATESAGMFIPSGVSDAVCDPRKELV